MSEPLAIFLAGAIRTATPLAFAATGELLVERAGVINIGLEGAIIGGAFGALIAAEQYGALAGFAGGALAGVAVTALFALLTVRLRADQIISGTALTLLALGVTGTLYRALYGATGAALSVPTMAPFAIPGLAAIPVLGPALFAQPPITYVLYLLVPMVWWWLYRTHAGLALRAAGESPEAARSSGIRVGVVRAAAVLSGGALGGIAGATLVVAQTGTFAEGMSAGRGFIAIAIVALGRWHPAGIALASLLFGAASALQYFFQSLGLEVPYHAFLALPYALTLLALAGAAGRVRAPAALGRVEAIER